MSTPPGTLRTYRGTALPDVYRWQAAAFVRTQWPDVGDGLVSEPYPTALRALHVVLADGDLLLGYAGVVSMHVRHAGGAWRVDGLGRVFTFPAVRGSGQGRRLVDAATGAIRIGGADLGALLCDPGLRRFYAGSGWTAVPPGVLIDPEDGRRRSRSPDPPCCCRSRTGPATRGTPSSRTR